MALLHNPNIVKEYVLPDGIGAQLWRKIYAMSYALDKDLLFQDTPITNFLVHESDKVYLEKDKQLLIDKFNNILYNPWKEIDFNSLKNKKLEPGIGITIPENQGMVIGGSNFLHKATSFNKFNHEKNNSIVIHLRRGNITKDNPRWVSDNIYVNILKQIPLLINKLDLVDPEIILITDSSDTIKKYKPMDEQKGLWNQSGINSNLNGEYIINSINLDLLLNIEPNLKVMNDLPTYDAFIKMVNASLLITAYSAFSQSAGLLSKNKVLGISNTNNGFQNSIGNIDSLTGKISFE